MNSPINAYSRHLGTSLLDRYNTEKLEKGASRPEAGAGQTSASGADELVLSDVAKQSIQDNSFDRAKVDAIKQAIQNGQYPLDAKRIAESFVAIEQMIKG